MQVGDEWEKTIDCHIQLHEEEHWEAAMCVINGQMRSLYDLPCVTGCSRDGKWIGMKWCRFDDLDRLTGPAKIMTNNEDHAKQEYWIDGVRASRNQRKKIKERAKNKPT